MTGRPRTLYGTIFFRGNGFMFDQILVSRGLLAGSGPLRVLEQAARIEGAVALMACPAARPQQPQQPETGGSADTASAPEQPLRPDR